MELEADVDPVANCYAALERKCRTNYGASVGTIPVREHVFNPDYKTVFAGDFLYDMMAAPGKSHTSMKWSTQVGAPDDVQRSGQCHEEGLQQGSVGVGQCAGYVVTGTTTDEAIICQELAGKYSQCVFIHCRFSS